MTFRVGQKVVCVDDTPDRYGRPLCLTKGSIYTVASIYFWLGRPALYLEEVERYFGAGWFSSRFRPLVEDKSSTFFTEGAPKDSEQFDNRRKIGVVA